jgi:hypothetical protein
MNKLQQFIQSKPCGFLTEADMPELIALDRLCPVLVRCGACRFTCAAQDCAHLITAIVAAKDYVRDVSFPVGAMERAASWQPDCPVTPVSMLPASFLELLEACKLARDTESENGCSCARDDEGHEPGCYLGILEAAIAKAEGQI